jgi:hypothetical protein
MEELSILQALKVQSEFGICLRSMKSTNMETLLMARTIVLEVGQKPIVRHSGISNTIPTQ